MAKPKRKTAKSVRKIAVARERKPGSRKTTEAELEARLQAVLKNVVPWLSDFRLQWQFKLQVGHNQIYVDGKKVHGATGRADIIVFSGEKSVAVFELKAPDVALTDLDRKQGLSYARLLDPMAPLVIVSNGADTKLYSTFSGSALPTDTLSSAQFKKNVEAATKLAETEAHDAIATLLGPDSAVAVDMINTLSRLLLHEITGAWSDNLRPFAERLIFPRKLSAIVDHALQFDTATVLLSGSPLAGKSNILRQLYTYSVDRRSVAFLYLEGSSTRQGILQVLANAFATQFDWPATVDDVRQWLRRVSKSEGMTLVIAVDDVEPASMAAEIDEFSSTAFGSRLKLVVTGTPAAISNLVATNGGRQATRLGRNGQVFDVAPLDDDEFEAASMVLRGHRIEFMPGAKHALEYRQPWVLRSIAGHVGGEDKYADDALAAAIPSLPGLFILHLAEQRFADLQELRGRFSQFCRAMLQDLSEAYHALAVSLVTSFTCRRSTLLKFLSEAELGQAVERGEFKYVLLEAEERAVVAQLPELAALSLSRQLGQRLSDMRREPGEQQAEVLESICSRILFGDVIGARALHECARLEGSLPPGLITTLISWAPKEERLKAGARFNLPLPNGKVVSVTVEADGTCIAKLPNGETERLPVEPGDLGMVYGRMMPWLILSYFAATPLAVAEKGGQRLGWVDASIIAGIAESPIVQHSVRGAEPRGLIIHEIPGAGSFVCHDEGVVEPVTYGLMQLMLHGEGRGEFLVEEALKLQSLPFVYRLYTALSMIAHLEDATRQAWARRLLKRLEAFLSSSSLLH